MSPTDAAVPDPDGAEAVVLRFFSPVSLAAIVIVVIAAVVSLVLGAPLGGVAAGLAVGSSAILSVLNPSIAELARPRPRLWLELNGTETRRQASVPRAHRPHWPIDIERIVRNEAAAARGTVPAEDDEPPSFALGATYKWGISAVDPPSQADYAKAREEFEQSVVQYEDGLRRWLEIYSAAARSRSLEHALAMAVCNRKGGAFAEAITIQLRLPERVSLSEETERMDPPPRRPMYVPPRPKPRYASAFRDTASPWPRENFSINRVDLHSLLPGAASPPGWRTTSDGALECQIKELHGDRRIALPPLQLQASEDGTDEIPWAIYTKSARSPVRGLITLAPPATSPPGPAFGGLAGILRFPDVPIQIDRPVTDDTPGTIEVDPRVEDPPTSPPKEAASTSILDRFRSSAEYNEWLSLGLDPQHDAPATKPDDGTQP